MNGAMIYMRHERSRVHSCTRTTNCCAAAQTVFVDAQREDRTLTRHLVCRYDIFYILYVYIPGTDSNGQHAAAGGMQLTRQGEQATHQ